MVRIVELYGMYILACARTHTSPGSGVRKTWVLRLTVRPWGGGEEEPRDGSDGGTRHLSQTSRDSSKVVPSPSCLGAFSQAVSSGWNESHGPTGGGVQAPGPCRVLSACLWRVAFRVSCFCFAGGDQGGCGLSRLERAGPRTGLDIRH